MWMAFLQHSPEDTAYGFGETINEAATALVAAYPNAAGQELDACEIAPGRGFTSQWDMKLTTISTGAPRSTGGINWRRK